MPPEEQHFPGQTENEFSAQEPEPETVVAPVVVEPKAEEPEVKQPEEVAVKPPEEPEQKPPVTPVIKKRSIYDEYKDEKNERKAWQGIAQQALQAQGIELTGKESLEDFQALLKKKDEAVTPLEKSEADDELTTFAKEQGMDPDALKKLTGIILKNVPTAEKPPEGLKPEEVEEWRAGMAKLKLAEENQAIDAQAPVVRTQLKDLGFEVHDDGELTKVMSRIKELSHTAEFHDKEIDYIVFKNRAELTKLVSPKKESFEAGDTRAEAAEEKGLDYSSAPTPGQMVQELERPSGSGIEIRRS